MSTHEQSRRAHELVDAIKDGYTPDRADVDFLRSFLPELPKQKTLEELRHEVYDAWIGADGNEWPDDAHGVLETWLAELHWQLQGLAPAAPAAAPALPDGMRIAVHAVYGRVVVSPVVDDDGTCKIFHLSTHARDGSDYCWAPIDSLTFIDYEPAKFAHPEFLETEEDYAEAPEGTIVACEDSPPWHKFDSAWLSTAAYEGNSSKSMSGIIREVLRWGNE